MPPITITELICLFFMTVVAYSLWQQHDARKSSFYIIITMICNMLALLSDAVSRIIQQNNIFKDEYSIIFALAFFMGNISFVPFILYCKEFIGEKVELKKRVFEIPLICSVIILIIIVIEFITGSVMSYNNSMDVNTMPIDNKFLILPFISGLLIIFVLVYLPVVAFRRRKYIGLKPVALMAIFGLFPLTAAMFFYDYIVIAGSMALVIVAVIMQNTIAYEKEKNEKILKEKAKELQYLNDELETAKAIAEASSEYKTIFLNNMSHDIRTPMNAIMGFAKLMENNIDNPTIVKDYLSKINRSGEYLLSIINNILEVARIDSGNEKIDESFVDLSSSKGAVTSLFEGEAKKKNIHFTSSVNNITHPYILADKPKIMEIFMNLVGNAMKYTPEGGTVSMVLNEIPSSKENYASFELIVSDNGIGMSEDFLEHIFDSFSRERNTTESKVIGTGLGMSIVKKLVDLLDGSVEVSSKLGEGTSIRVVTSHRIVENPELYLEKRHDNITDSFNFEGKRILLAEDNELNAEIACGILEEFKINVEHAIDGVACAKMIDNAEDNYYDLILMDIQMPNMNGYETTKYIRSLENSKKSQIPIIAMTANAFEEDKKKAIDCGMNNHVGKPIDIHQLTEAIANALSNK